MTPEEINRSIAEITGLGVRPFESDLNAMHDAELWLARNRPELENAYDLMLRRVVQGVISEDGVAVGGNALPEGQFYVALLRRATALQRAETFLRTTGKWKDS